MILSTTLNVFVGLFSSDFRAIFVVLLSPRHCVFPIIFVPIITLIVIELEARSVVVAKKEDAGSFLAQEI